MFLSDAPAGASFKVRRVTLEKEVGKRLADMGFTQDAEGAVVRRGFFNGPLQVRLLGYDILIRRFEASGIEVAPVGDWSAVEDAINHRGHLWHWGERRPEPGNWGLGHGENTRKEKKSWKPNCCE
jgi:ferrous iron transport protein A